MLWSSWVIEFALLSGYWIFLWIETNPTMGEPNWTILWCIYLKHAFINIKLQIRPVFTQWTFHFEKSPLGSPTHRFRLAAFLSSSMTWLIERGWVFILSACRLFPRPFARFQERFGQQERRSQVLLFLRYSVFLETCSIPRLNWLFARRFVLGIFFLCPPLGT